MNHLEDVLINWPLDVHSEEIPELVTRDEAVRIIREAQQ